MRDLTISPFFRFPTFWDEDDISVMSQNTTGLSISEDEKNVYVEAAIPGIDPKDIEVTFDKGVVWIKGEAQEIEDDKKKKFYRRLANSFSYRVAVPGDLDQNVEPQASCKNGVMRVTFAKSPKTQPKKITVKS